MTVSLDIALVATIVSIIGGFIGIAIATRKAAKGIAEAVILEHERDCPVRVELRDDIKERDDRMERRLGGIEDELRSLNHYLRNGRNKVS